MSYNALYYVCATLFGSWIVLLVQWLRATNELKRLKHNQPLCSICKGTYTNFVNPLREMGYSAETAIKALQSLSSVGKSNFQPPTTYQDEDGDGVPDVFQRRKPLSELLEFEKLSGNHSNDYWVAIEFPPRPLCKGEYYISVGGHIDKAEFDFANYSAVIIKSVPGTNLDDLVDLTK